jgi:2-methylcitrate dehydratase PrpD
VNAFGIVLSQAAGSLQFLDNGSWTKRFQVGWAAMSGLTAATLAARGFSGASAAIEGKHGFLNAHAPSPSPERVVEALGTRFDLMDTGVKPYPSCRWGHAGIDAVIELKSRHAIAADDIVSVRLGLSRAGILLIGDPIAKKQAPRNTVEAQFSGPFVIATALLHGNVEWDSYRRLGEPGLMALCRKVEVWNDPEIEAEFPANMSGSVEIVTKSGSFGHKVVVPKGDPANFPSEADTRAKYLGLVGDYLPAAQAERLAAKLMGLDEQPVIDLRPDR